VTQTLEAFVEAAFAHFALDWQQHVDVDRSLFRPSDLKLSRANPNKAKELLGWQASSGMREVIAKMIEGV